MDRAVAMLHPSKRLLFAIEAVLDIAYYGGSQPVQSGEISGRQGSGRWPHAGERLVIRYRG